LQKSAQQAVRSLYEVENRGVLAVLMTGYLSGIAVVRVDVASHEPRSSFRLVLAPVSYLSIQILFM
jgi:hypothetical protein